MNMSLKNLAKTYPWTQDAANAAINKFQGGATEACIIMPTGSGKTIASSLVIDALFKGQTILYLAPSWAILDQTKERYTSHGFMNIYYMTYMMMMRSVKKNKTFTIKPDLIITDEFHRLGALEWGKAWGSIRGIFPDTKVLGLTATEIRYLDGGRDMSDELFGNHGDYYMDLLKAWNNKILTAPIYWVSHIDEMTELNNMITTIRDRVKDEQSRNTLLELARVQMKNYDRTYLHGHAPRPGVQDILANAVPKSTRKILVFCEDIASVSEIRDLLKVDLPAIGFTNVKFYEIHCKKSQNPKTIKDFEKDEKDTLKVLLSVNMLNEGVHVHKAHVEIMYRGTSSRNIFLQQIGRVMSIGYKSKPVIIDLVKNIYISDFVNPYLSQAYQKQQQLITTGGSNSKDPYSLEIHGEVLGLQELRIAIDKALSYDQKRILQLNQMAKAGNFSFLQSSTKKGKKRA